MKPELLLLLKVKAPNYEKNGYFFGRKREYNLGPIQWGGTPAPKCVVCKKQFKNYEVYTMKGYYFNGNGSKTIKHLDCALDKEIKKMLMLDVEFGRVVYE